MSLMYLKNVVTLQFDKAKCIGCYVCLSVCPREVLAAANGTIEIESRDACMECGACQRNCPSGAVTVKTGVGCASAVINQLLGRKSGCCCVMEEDAQGPSPRSSCC